MLAVTDTLSCAQNGHRVVAELLLDAGAAVNATTVNGATPLYIASAENREDLVGLLLERGADVNQVV